MCTKWGLTQNAEKWDVVYLLDVQHLQVELPQLRAVIKLQDKKDKPTPIILDERGVGLGLWQELYNEGYRHITGSTSTKEQLEYASDPGVRPNASKVERFGMATWPIEEGRVLLPTAAPWLEAFLYEVAAFPNIADKDQVDSMTQLLANLRRAILLARQNVGRFTHRRRH